MLELVSSTGANPSREGGLDVPRLLRAPTRVKVWFSATVVHYTGNGIWTVGLAPIPSKIKLNAPKRWEWIEDLSTDQVVDLLGREKTHGIVRCSTEEVREILRGCP